MKLDHVFVELVEGRTGKPRAIIAALKMSEVIAINQYTMEDGTPATDSVMVAMSGGQVYCVAGSLKKWVKLLGIEASVTV